MRIATTLVRRAHITGSLGATHSTLRRNGCIACCMSPHLCGSLRSNGRRAPALPQDPCRTDLRWTLTMGVMLGGIRDIRPCHRRPRLTSSAGMWRLRPCPAFCASCSGMGPAAALSCAWAPVKTTSGRSAGAMGSSGCMEGCSRAESVGFWKASSRPSRVVA